MELTQLWQDIQAWGQELGFQRLSVSDTKLSSHSQHLQKWLQQEFHGEMTWMNNNKEKRQHPELLHQGTIRVITARMDYRPKQSPELPAAQNDNGLISCYAHGRDYHKTIRNRLSRIAKRINLHAPHNYRAFVDSAPVLERALAEKSGLGWIGKNSMLINKDAGSWFFLGEIFTNLPLPTEHKRLGADLGNTNHCGTCTSCIDSCPTNAIVAPYQVDARRCISYLTIEHKGEIPEPFRKAMGNRIFGCDDCQIVCPWNKFSSASNEQDFSAKDFTQNQSLADLFLWEEPEFLQKTEGSPLRRLGYERWLRNIAVALGNATPTTKNIEALNARAAHSSELVRSHVQWALEQLTKNAANKKGT